MNVHFLLNDSPDVRLLIFLEGGRLHCHQEFLLRYTHDLHKNFPLLFWLPNKYPKDGSTDKLGKSNLERLKSPPAVNNEKKETYGEANKWSYEGQNPKNTFDIIENRLKQKADCSVCVLIQVLGHPFICPFILEKWFYHLPSTRYCLYKINKTLEAHTNLWV